MPNYTARAPGSLRERIVIKSRNFTQSTSTGEKVADWNTTYLTLWADAEMFAGGKDTDSAQKTTVKANLRFIVRFRTDLNETMRVVWRGAVWNVQSIVPDSAKFYMDLLCAKVE